jgi:hypothetical protein
MAASTSIIMTLPAIDLTFHELSVFITSLRFWIVSKRLFGGNLNPVSVMGII